MIIQQPLSFSVASVGSTLNSSKKMASILRHNAGKSWAPFESATGGRLRRRRRSPVVISYTIEASVGKNATRYK